MRGLEDGVAGDVIDVAAGRDADAADLRGERVAQIIAVQVQRGDDVEIRRAREHLLERDVGDGVLDDDARAGFAFGNFAPRAAVHLHRAEFASWPVRSPSRGSAPSVYFMMLPLWTIVTDLLLFGDGVLRWRSDEPLRAGLGNGLDADADDVRAFRRSGFS